MIEGQRSHPVFSLAPAVGKKQELQLKKEDKIYKDLSIEISKSDKLKDPKLGFFDKLRGKVMVKTQDGSYVKVSSRMIKTLFNIKISDQKAEKNRDVTSLISRSLKFEEVLTHATNSIQHGNREIAGGYPKKAKSYFDSAFKSLELASMIAEPGQKAQITEQLKELGKAYFESLNDKEGSLKCLELGMKYNSIDDQIFNYYIEKNIPAFQVKIGVRLVLDPHPATQENGAQLLRRAVLSAGASKELKITAYRSLAKFYISRDTDEERKLGKYYAESAIKEGDKKSHFYLGEFYRLNKDQKEACDEYKKAAAAGMHAAQLQLALSYEDEAFRNFMTFPESLGYLRQAAKSDDFEIQANAMENLAKNMVSLPEDIELMKSFFNSQPASNREAKYPYISIAIEKYDKTHK